MFIRAPDFLVGPRSADDSRFIGSRKRSWSTRVLECGIAFVVAAIVGQITFVTKDFGCYWRKLRPAGKNPTEGMKVVSVSVAIALNALAQQLTQARL
jgi:hypothetical protein